MVLALRRESRAQLGGARSVIDFAGLSGRLTDAEEQTARLAGLALILRWLEGELWLVEQSGFILLDVDFLDFFAQLCKKFFLFCVLATIGQVPWVCWGVKHDAAAKASRVGSIRL